MSRMIHSLDEMEDLDSIIQSEHEPHHIIEEEEEEEEEVVGEIDPFEAEVPSSKQQDTIPAHLHGHDGTEKKGTTDGWVKGMDMDARVTMIPYAHGPASVQVADNQERGNRIQDNHYKRAVAHGHGVKGAETVNGENIIRDSPISNGGNIIRDSEFHGHRGHDCSRDSLQQTIASIEALIENQRKLVKDAEKEIEEEKEKEAKEKAEWTDAMRKVHEKGNKLLKAQRMEKETEEEAAAESVAREKARKMEIQRIERHVRNYNIQLKNLKKDENSGFVRSPAPRTRLQEKLLREVDDIETKRQGLIDMIEEVKSASESLVDTRENLLKETRLSPEQAEMLVEHIELVDKRRELTESVKLDGAKICEYKDILQKYLAGQQEAEVARTQAFLEFERKKQDYSTKLDTVQEYQDRWRDKCWTQNLDAEVNKRVRKHLIAKLTELDVEWKGKIRVLQGCCQGLRSDISNRLKGDSQSGVSTDNDELYIMQASQLENILSRVDQYQHYFQQKQDAFNAWLKALDNDNDNGGDGVGGGEKTHYNFKQHEDISLTKLAEIQEFEDYTTQAMQALTLDFELRDKQMTGEVARHKLETHKMQATIEREEKNRREKQLEIQHIIRKEQKHRNAASLHPRWMKKRDKVTVYRLFAEERNIYEEHSKLVEELKKKDEERQTLRTRLKEDGMLDPVLEEDKARENARRFASREEDLREALAELEKLKAEGENPPSNNAANKEKLSEMEENCKKVRVISRSHRQSLSKAQESLKEKMQNLATANQKLVTLEARRKVYVDQLECKDPLGIRKDLVFTSNSRASTAVTASVSAAMPSRSRFTPREREKEFPTIAEVRRLVDDEGVRFYSQVAFLLRGVRCDIEKPTHSLRGSTKAHAPSSARTSYNPSTTSLSFNSSFKMGFNHHPLQQPNPNSGRSQMHTTRSMCSNDMKKDSVHLTLDGEKNARIILLTSDLQRIQIMRAGQISRVSLGFVKVCRLKRVHVPTRTRSLLDIDDPSNLEPLVMDLHLIDGDAWKISLFDSHSFQLLVQALETLMGADKTRLTMYATKLQL